MAKYVNPTKDYYYCSDFPEPEVLISDEDLLKSIAISLRKISENLYEIAANGVKTYPN